MTATGLGLILVIGLADYTLDSDVSLELIDYVPIALVAWYAGRLRDDATVRMV